MGHMFACLLLRHPLIRGSLNKQIKADYTVFMITTQSKIKLRLNPLYLLKKTILLITFIFISACSSSSEEEKLWTPSAYKADHEGTRIDLSLHSLDGIEDILQADVMIHRIDGSGPSFEVQNASVEQDDDVLSFDWIDGFENKGSAQLKILSTKDHTVLLKLKVDEVVNERDMMFITDYVLTKVPTGPSESSSDESSEDK